MGRVFAHDAFNHTPWLANLTAGGLVNVCCNGAFGQPFGHAQPARNSAGAGVVLVDVSRAVSRTCAEGDAVGQGRAISAMPPVVSALPSS
jgi:hypothetical protein